MSLWILSAVAATAVGQAGGERIELNFPANLDLKVFVGFVSDRLKLNILYDEQTVGNMRVTIKAAEAVPEEALLGLLESTLRMNGLSLVAAEEPGWRRIVQARNFTEFSQAGAAADDARALQDQAAAVGGSRAVTQVFSVRHGATRSAAKAIQPFLSTQQGASVLELEEQGLLIVTDFASNLPRLAKLIELVDRPAPEVEMAFVPAEHLEASALAQQVSQLVMAKRRAQGLAVSPRGGTSGAGGLDISHDARTNQLILIGTAPAVAEARAIMKSLDVPLQLDTRVYQFSFASPERVDRLTRELVGDLVAKRLYRSTIDTDAQLLIVTATLATHATVERLKGDLDVNIGDASQPSRVRFYKLAHATASDVLETIRALEGGRARSGSGSGGRRQGLGDLEIGDQRPPTAQGEPRSVGPAQRRLDPDASEGDARRDPAWVGDRLRPILPSVETRGGATITADINTNTLIVVADPQEHRVYEELIRRLDQRRPQVLVEVTVVTLDTSDNFALGVNIEGRATAGDTTLRFSSIGLTGGGSGSGGISVEPGLGFTGVVISPDIADLVIRALASSGRSKVMSAPRILVNDNATGSLSSIAEQPFTSLNASDTVSTTSFGGFVSAGTDISITPQISEGGHVKMSYSVTLNSFTGEGGDGLPAPRQTNNVQSEVTIPDGHTIVVGGLNQHHFSDSVQGFPFLKDIPLIRHLFSSQSLSNSESTLFVFVRPVVLRDDAFRDLKYYSQRDVEAAGVDGDFPESEPLLIR